MNRSLAIYMALETETEDQEVLQTLSSKGMKWDQGIWILDLKGFMSYWKRQAAKLEVPVTALWRRILDERFEEKNFDPQVLHLKPGYTAALAVHPWQAVILLEGLRQKGQRGLFVQSSGQGGRLWQELSWEVWLASGTRLSKHLDQTKAKRFQSPRFKVQLERFCTTAKKLGLQNPMQSRILSRMGIQRRYGRFVAQLWAWSFVEQDPVEESADEIRFPWIDWSFTEPWSSERTTDYPMRSWPEIARELTEELRKLKLELKKRGELLVSLSWMVRLDGLPEILVPVRFRNPFDLQDEEKSFNTVLFQAEHRLSKILADSLLAGEGQPEPLITGWVLTLDESVKVPNLFLDLFGAANNGQSDEEALATLENEVPVALQRYRTVINNCPEWSFQAWDALESEEDEADFSLQQAVKQRPFSIYKTPKPLGSNPSGKNLPFLENSGNPWWQPGQENNPERRYYKLISHQNESYWVYRDSKGNWFEHGRFD